MYRTQVISKRSTAVLFLDKFVSCLAFIFLSPVFIFNAVFCLATSKSIVVHTSRLDAVGRPFSICVFNDGFLKQSACLWDVLFGSISLCGVSMYDRVSDVRGLRCDLPVGIFSVFGVKKNIGEGMLNHRDTLELHMRERGIGFHLGVLFRGLLNDCFYRGTQLQDRPNFALQGIRVDNCTMTDAIDWIVADRPSGKAVLASFINVNSINLARSNDALASALARSDRSFADGSGVRIAARHQGVLLKDNVNGTDLLPQLCKQLQTQGLSLFLLGSAPGVADEATRELKKQFPDLNIVGSHHGYFSDAENERVINKINAAKPHLCLVAMGSPRQELWLDQNRDQLKVSCAMAVGGLFDFYSGRIPRAPVWMRDIGFEWLWRLWQEPSNKFHRYVIGNPQFLFNTYFGKTLMTKPEITQ